MKLINTGLLRPRNVLVIGLIALAAHIVASPLYKLIDGTAGPSAGPSAGS